MATPGNTAYDADELLAAHRLYDQAVDVVSAFEWLFTSTREMPATVHHFERFPRVTADDGEPATPDFSVAFSDGSGLVGEIARFALPEQSVDALCAQLHRYDGLRKLPGPGGATLDVAYTDVILLVPIDLGTDAVKRIIRDRYEAEAHDFAPSVAPCIVQFVGMSERYVFQRRPDEGNGTLRDGERNPALGAFFASDFKAPAAGFAQTKTTRPFVNDPIAPLYLACHLWTKTLATIAAAVPRVGDYRPISITTSEIAAALREQTGVGRSADVEKAMEILVRTRAAVQTEHGWGIAWGPLGHTAGEDISEVLARRSAKPPAKGPVRRLQEAAKDARIDDPFAPAHEPENVLFDRTEYE